jgi:phosphoribosylformylglycinamidine (FGAM) synthase-like enzyme
VPAQSLVLGGGAPVYEREYHRPGYFDQIEAFSPALILEPENLVEVAKKLIQSPNIASKHWIFEQYDKMVRTGTMTSTEQADAAVVRIHKSDKALCLTTDCNSAYVYLDPHIGGQIAVSECARNISCSGGIPVAITNCLNFGNPYNPEVYWQFVHALKGMGEACLKYDTPVTGGNVSFYNQTVNKDKTEPVYPTPTIGMLGLMEHKDLLTTISFKNQGDLIYLLGHQNNHIGYSEYLNKIHGVVHAPAPYFNLDEEFKVHQSIQGLIRKKLVQSAHDVSEGGIFCSLAESGFSSKDLGFRIRIPENYRKDIFLFGESQGRILVTLSPENQKEFEQFLQQNNQLFHLLGEVSESYAEVDGQIWGKISDFLELYTHSISRHF